MSTPRVAIITVTYRSAADIGDFLASLPETITGDDVVVVDNRSEQSDEIARIVEATGSRLVRLSDNRGYGSAVNAGAEVVSSADFLLICNPDVRLHPGTVEALGTALDRDVKVAAVGPKTLDEAGSVYPSARRVPSLRAGVGHALFSRVWPANPWTRHYRDDEADPDGRRLVGWLSGACLMVRAEAFHAIGGFDDRYFMYFEDVDLGYRLGRAGWKNLYEPTAVVTHVGATSTATARAEMLRTHHRSAYRFLARKYRGWYLAPLRWALHLGLNVRAWWLTRGMS